VIAFLAARIASALVVVLGVACLVFLLIHLVPGDPVEVMLGESARAGDREAVEASTRLQAQLLRLLGAHDERGRGAVADLRAVARSGLAVLLEGGTQPGELLGRALDGHDHVSVSGADRQLSGHARRGERVVAADGERRGQAVLL